MRDCFFAARFLDSFASLLALLFLDTSAFASRLPIAAKARGALLRLITSGCAAAATGWSLLLS